MSPSITNPTVFGRLVSLSSATKGVTSNDKGLPGTKGPSRPNWVMGSRLLQRDPPNLDLRIRSLRCFITTFGRFGLFAHRTCRQQPGNPLVAGEKETNRPRAVTCELIRAYHRVPEALGLLPNRFRVRRTPASSLFRGQISLAAQKLFEAGAVGAEVGGNRGLEGELLVRDRMPELELPRMEHLTRRNGIDAVVERGLPVGLVSDDRTAERGHVHADLVGAAGLDEAGDDGDGVGARVVGGRGSRRCRCRKRKDFPVGDGDLAVLLDDRHALAVDGVASDQVLDASGVEAGASVADGEVGLLDVLVRGEGLDESVHRGLRLGDDDESRRVLVESVDEPDRK